MRFEMRRDLTGEGDGVVREAGAFAVVLIACRAVDMVVEAIPIIPAARTAQEETFKACKIVRILDLRMF